MHSIPRPTRSNLSVKELESEMTNMNEKRFSDFKAYVRAKARKNLSYGGITKQNPARWNQVKSQVLLAFPELKEYEQQWPLEAYFHKFSKNDKKNRADQREQVGSSTLATAAPPKRRQVIFVGKTPKRLGRCHTRMTTDMEHATLAILPGDPPMRSLTHSANITTDSQTGGILSDLVCSENTVQVIDTGANSMAQASARASYEDNDGSFDYPVPCVRCGDVPILAPSSNKEISEVLRAENTLISVFSSLGIVSDHHLSVYRNWGTTTFLNSLPAGIINPLHKAALEKYLNENLVKNRSAEVNNEASFNPVCTKFKALSFPRPSPEHEARIVQASSSGELRKAMGLEDDMAHYILLTKTIDDVIKGMDMQSEQWSHIVDKICNDCPELDNFENTWPISFYVRWKHARVCSERLQNIASREKTAVCSARNLMEATENFTVTSSNSGNRDSSRGISQLKGAPWSGCLVHPLPTTLNTSPKLLAHLRAFGMEELLPVFLSVETKTDNDFDLFSNLDEESRLSVFNYLGNTFRLRPFQKMMLGVVIQEAGTTGN